MQHFSFTSENSDIKIRSDAGWITALLATQLSLSAPPSMPLPRYACHSTPAPSLRHPGVLAAPPRRLHHPTPAFYPPHAGVLAAPPMRSRRPTQELLALTAGILLLLTDLTLHLRLPCAGRFDSGSTRVGIRCFSLLRPLLQVLRLPRCWSPITCAIHPTPSLLLPPSPPPSSCSDRQGRRPPSERQGRRPWRSPTVFCSAR